jgi:hypothetical protein
MFTTHQNERVFLGGAGRDYAPFKKLTVLDGSLRERDKVIKLI